MQDTVDHPNHYTNPKINCACGRAIECIDVVRHQNFNIGNVIKYVWRHEHKNGLEDLKKAAWYITNEIERLENEK